ncbi:hypothetical protein HRH25_19450 [Flavisolibacter sp. BT320]|nr:hypothetical protein [Flavisolibacter longurius]
MNCRASVLFQNAIAHYTITEEEEGVFLAHLQHFSGLSEETPPLKILLMRGIRRWIGSLDNQQVLDALGHAIDKKSTWAAPAKPLSQVITSNQTEQPTVDES